MQTLLSNNFTDSELLKGNVCFYIFYLIQLFSQLTFGCSQILRGRTHFFTLTLIFCLNSLRTWSVSCALFFERSASVSNVRLLNSLSVLRWAVISGSLCVFCCPVTSSSMLMCGMDLFINFCRPTFCLVREP